MNTKIKAGFCLLMAVFIFLAHSNLIYAAIAGGAASRATANAARSIDDQDRKRREMKKQAEKQKKINEEGGLISFSDDYKQ